MSSKKKMISRWSCWLKTASAAVLALLTCAITQITTLTQSTFTSLIAYMDFSESFAVIYSPMRRNPGAYY